MQFPGLDTKPSNILKAIMMVIQTERLLIMQTDEETVKEIKEQADDTQIDNYLDSLSLEQKNTISQDRERVAQLLKYLCTITGSDSRETYGAWLDKQLVDYIALVNGQADIPELQIEIAAEFQGNGYGYELLNAVLEDIFMQRRYSNVRYTSLLSNTASISIAEKVAAALQVPNSEAEKLLMKIYIISKSFMAACHKKVP